MPRFGLHLTTVNHPRGADEATHILQEAGERESIVSAGTAELAEAVVGRRAESDLP